MKIKDKYYKETEYLLYNYKMFQISIENMQQEIELLKEEDGTAAITYDGIKTSPTFKFQSSTEDTALSVMEKIDYLEHSIRRIQNRLESIDRALEGLGVIERAIINKRYFEGKQWYEIAYKVSYNERWVKELRRRSINKIAIGLFGDTALLEHESVNKR